MWDLPRPGLEPVSPALAGGFLTTAPPGKSLKTGFFAWLFCFVYLQQVHLAANPESENWHETIFSLYLSYFGCILIHFDVEILPFDFEVLSQTPMEWSEYTVYCTSYYFNENWKILNTKTHLAPKISGKHGRPVILHLFVLHKKLGRQYCPHLTNE